MIRVKFSGSSGEGSLEPLEALHGVIGMLSNGAEVRRRTNRKILLRTSDESRRIFLQGNEEEMADLICVVCWFQEANVESSSLIEQMHFGRSEPQMFSDPMTPDILAAVEIEHEARPASSFE